MLTYKSGPWASRSIWPRIWEVVMAFGVLVGILGADVLADAPAAEFDVVGVLPSQTKLLIWFANYPEFSERIAGTQHGKIWRDATMREFRRSILEQPIRLSDSLTGDAALTPAELGRLATGSAGYAVVATSGGKPRGILLVQVAGKLEEAAALMAAAAQRATGRGAQVTSNEEGGFARTVITAKPGAEERPLVTMLLRDGWLAIIQGKATAELMVQRWSGQATASLATDPVYASVTQACQGPDASGTPDVSWYVDPIAYAQLYFVFDSESDDIGPQAFAEKHGFDSLRGVAGQLHLAVGGHDMLVQMAVEIALPTRHAMKMLEFSSLKDLSPPAWVASHVSAYTSLSWPLVKIIDHGGPLFDDEAADGMDGTFEDILNDTRSAEGPGVDLRNDLFMRLGPAITQISEPATATDQDNIVAVEARDPAFVANMLSRLLRDDPDVQRLRVEGLQNDVWQVPLADFSHLNLTVAGGQLLISTNLDLIKQVTNNLPVAQRLTGADDWQRVLATWQPFVDADKTFLATFARPQDDLVAAYEYLRAGAVGTSDSIYVQLMSKMMDVRSTSGVDFKKMPPFEKIRDYFGPVGFVAKSTKTGWLFNGFALPPSPQVKSE